MKNERFTDRKTYPRNQTISGVFSFVNSFANQCPEKLRFSEIFVQGCLAYPGKLIDFLSRVFSGLVELDRLFHKLRICGRSAALATSGTSGSKSLAGSVCNHITLKLSQCRHQSKMQLSRTGGCIDGFFQLNEIDAFLIEGLHQPDEIFSASPPTRERLDDNRIPRC